MMGARRRPSSQYSLKQRAAAPTLADNPVSTAIGTEITLFATNDSLWQFAAPIHERISA